MLFCDNYVIKGWGEWKLRTNFKLISMKTPLFLSFISRHSPSFWVIFNLPFPSLFMGCFKKLNSFEAKSFIKCFALSCCLFAMALSQVHKWENGFGSPSEARSADGSFWTTGALSPWLCRLQALYCDHLKSIAGRDPHPWVTPLVKGLILWTLTPRISCWFLPFSSHPSRGSCWLFSCPLSVATGALGKHRHSHGLELVCREAPLLNRRGLYQPLSMISVNVDVVVSVDLRKKSVK